MVFQSAFYKHLWLCTTIALNTRLLFNERIFLKYLIRTQQSNKSKNLSFVSASVLPILLGWTSILLDNFLFWAAIFPMAKFSTVATVVSGVFKSPEVVWFQRVQSLSLAWEGGIPKLVACVWGSQTSYVGLVKLGSRWKRWRMFPWKCKLSLFGCHVFHLAHHS